jgi:hypothetical protein
MKAVVSLSVLLVAAPAAAWDFVPSPVCTLSHATEEAEVTVTYDPRRTQAWTIAVTVAGSWPAAPTFGIAFDGPRALSIGTDRHVLGDGGRTLSVSDTGFGNVLDGLQFNATATAVSGDRSVILPLDGAAPEVEKLRACAEGGLA